MTVSEVAPATPADPPPVRPRRRWARPSGVLLAVAAGFWVTAGLWSDPAGRMIAGNVPDATHYSWWLGWTPHALASGGSPFLTTAMNWPDGVSTMNNTTLLLPAVLLSPLTALAGSLVTLNLLNALAVPACALAGYWALRRIGTGRAAAVAGAAVFALSPAVVNSLVGHVTMAFAPALPVLVALSVMAWRGAEGDPSPVRAGLLLGAVATAQVFTGEEVLFQAGVGALVVLLVAAASRPRVVGRGARRLAVALGCAFAVFLPIAGYPLYLQFLGPLHQEGSPFLKDYYGADLTGFTTPTERVWLHRAADAVASARFPGGIEERLAYLGWPLLLTAAALLVLRRRDVRARCAVAGLVLAGALSLGGRIWVGGEWTERAGPYRLLQELPVTEASLASRFGLLAALFAGAVLALAVDAVLGRREAEVPATRTRRRLAAAVLAVACVAPLVPRPVPTVPAPAVPVFFTEAGRYLQPDDVVVVLPYPDPVQPVAMRWQSVAGYGFRRPGGDSLGRPGAARAYVGGAADPPTARLLAQVASDGVRPLITEVERDQAAADLALWQADAVVLGPAVHEEALRGTVTDLLGGRSPVEIGGVALWRDPRARP